MIRYKLIDTPLDKMIVAESDGKLCLLEFVDNRSPKRYIGPIEKLFGTKSIEENSPILKILEEQLNAYFNRKLRIFDLPMIFAGTDFQKLVWKRLCEIPYGQTVNYGWIASQIGNPSASRAVGRANGSNPISIVVPCHRVIGKNGELIGYGGKLWRKKWLLEHEGALQPDAL